MASELSREQVELMQKTVAMGYGLTLDCANAQQLLDTYAALREQLDSEKKAHHDLKVALMSPPEESALELVTRPLRERMEELEHENKNLLTCQCEQCDGSLLEDAVCRKCFAALTAKVEQLKNLLAVKRQLLVLEEEKVARLTARCEAAEQERDSALEAYNSVIDLSQSLKDSTIQSLQQQLAEREQRITTLEARITELGLRYPAL